MPAAVALRKGRTTRADAVRILRSHSTSITVTLKYRNVGSMRGHPMVRALLSVATVGVCVLASLAPSAAADLPVSGRGATQQAWCGPCGCLRVDFDYRRELRSTYGTGFDPRNYDETQPHYYFGPIRPYPRYSVDDCPGPN
jgi:hypothetical protein